MIVKAETLLSKPHEVSSSNSHRTFVPILPLFVFSLSFAHLPLVSSGVSSSDPCSSAIASGFSDPSVYSSPAAINLAMNSSELKSATTGSTLEFNSIYHISTENLSGGTCTVTLQSVNVAFDMSNGSVAVVSENPNSTQVVGVSLQTANFKLSTNTVGTTGIYNLTPEDEYAYPPYTSTGSVSSSNAFTVTYTGSY